MNTNIDQIPHNPNQLTFLAGIAFIGMALCYITLFVLYGAVIDMPIEATTAQNIAYLIENKGLFNLSYILGYIAFACLLCFCVYVTSCLYQQASKTTMAMASLFGYFWVVVLLCTGMIGISANELLASQNLTHPATAEVIFHTRNLMTESLGGGIEFIGGVWLLLLALASLRHKLLSTPLTLFTLVKGAIGVVTLFCTDSLLREMFGVTGIIWFIWMGIVLLKKRDQCSSVSQQNSVGIVIQTPTRQILVE